MMECSRIPVQFWANGKIILMKLFIYYFYIIYYSDQDSTIMASYNLTRSFVLEK